MQCSVKEQLDIFSCPKTHGYNIYHLFIFHISCALSTVTVTSLSLLSTLDC